MIEEQTETYTLEQYLEYEADLERKICTTSLERFYNESFVHAAMVLRALIMKAINEQVSMLYMYCGEFSLFRDAKAKELSLEINRIKPSEDSDKYMKWEGFKPYESLIKTLSLYFDNGGKMMLIVDKDISEITNEKVWSSLKSYFVNGTIEAYRLSSPIGLNHFFVAGSSYRRERDHDSKKAVCCFNNWETSNMLITSHQLLRSVSNRCDFFIDS